MLAIIILISCSQNKDNKVNNDTEIAFVDSSNTKNQQKYLYNFNKFEL